MYLQDRPLQHVLQSHVHLHTRLELINHRPSRSLSPDRYVVPCRLVVSTAGCCFSLPDACFASHIKGVVVAFACALLTIIRAGAFPSPPTSALFRSASIRKTHVLVAPTAALLQKRPWWRFLSWSYGGEASPVEPASSCMKV
jgi:hypothetical protein